MKKILSVLLAILMMSIATVTAFAGSTADDSNDGNTYSSLSEAKNDVLSLVNAYRLHFIYYDKMVPPEVPMWSISSQNNLSDVLNTVEKTIPDCKTIDECVEQRKLIEDAVDTLYIDSSELKWIIDYLKKDYESTDYYDADTTAEIKSVYEQAQANYNSENEREINISYFELRNLLDKLCLYNLVVGDVNNDGIFNVDDITLMQKNFAGLTKFNSSQNFLSTINEHSNIDIVTSWQIELTETLSNSNIDRVNKEINILSNSEFLNPDEKYFAFTPYTEQDNYIYCDDCYYPWWPIN